MYIGKILFVASQHGNEHLGEKLYAHALEFYPELVQSIDYVLANPQARHENKRYIMSDMNRSYRVPEETYEATLAKQLLEYIQLHAYTLVLDLHTTTANQQPCIIINHFNKTARRFLRSSCIRTVVQMDDEIAAHSLIGNCPQAVSIEVNNQSITTELLDSLCRTVQNFIDNRVVTNTINLYKVSEMLRAGDIDPVVAINFVRYADSFYPILLGEHAYQQEGQYLGFKASKKQQVRL